MIRFINDHANLAVFSLATLTVIAQFALDWHYARRGRS